MVLEPREQEDIVIIDTNIEIDEDVVDDNEFEDNMLGIHLDLFGQTQ